MDQVTNKFRSLWLIISDVVIEAPKDITSCTLVNFCDHIQIVCSSLGATNADKKKKLDTVISVLPDLTEIYVKTIDKKIIIAVVAIESLVEALVDGFALMDKMHDWSGSLAIMNQLVYPLRE